MTVPHDPKAFETIAKIERPVPALWTYYLLLCLLHGPLLPIVVLPWYFRYHTMRYRFDTEGISMKWGILFRREINLTYSRIQDIHLKSNLIERWLGLARVQIQTASGSSGAEMTIEGIKEYDLLRDFLYARMRGHHVASAVADATGSPATGGDGALGDVAASLREVAAELRALRADLASRRAGDV